MFLVPSLVALSAGFAGVVWYGLKAFGDFRGRIDTTVEAIDFGKNLVLAAMSVCVLLTALHSLVS